MPQLDGIMGEMEPGDLIGVMADAKAGKTSMGCQIARHAAKFGPVLFFSMEMKADQISLRLLSQESRVPEAVIKAGKYTDVEFEKVLEAHDRIDRLPIHIVDRARMKVSQMRGAAMDLKRRKGLVLTIDDHLKHIQPEIRTRDRWEGYENVMIDKKAMQKDLEVPGVLLMQRTRSSFDRPNPRPRADDAYGGGATVENVDSMLAIWREEKWLEQHRPAEDEKGYGRNSEPPIDAWTRKLERARGKAELINVARRSGPPDKSFPCEFRADYLLYEPLNAGPQGQLDVGPVPL